MLRARSDLLSSLPTIITGVTTHSILETFIRQTEDARKRGREVVLKPPMTAKQIGGLERRCRTSLHAQERELVEYTEGVTIDGFEVDFSGEHAFFEFEALTPAGIPIAADGFGNFWVVDIAEDGLWSRVLFICHDPPAVGRGGPRSELIRNGRLLMFGVEKKKPGLLRSLLSKMSS